MTAIIEINEQYAQQFNELIQSLPPKAVKLTPLKNNLNDEISKRIKEIKNCDIVTKPLNELYWLRERYVSD